MVTSIVISEFSIGNLSFVVPAHLDMHITLAYIRGNMSPAESTRFRVCMERQFRSRWKPVNGSPLDFGVAVYGTEDDYIWRFTTFSPGMKDLQALLNVIHSFDRNSKNSATLSFYERTLHLSVYQRHRAPVWIGDP